MIFAVFYVKKFIFVIGTGFYGLYPRKKTRGTRKIGSQEATEPASRTKTQKTAKIQIFS